MHCSRDRPVIFSQASLTASKVPLCQHETEAGNGAAMKMA